MLRKVAARSLVPRGSPRPVKSLGAELSSPTSKSSSPSRSARAAHRQRGESRCPSGASRNIRVSPANAVDPPVKTESHPVTSAASSDPGPPASSTQML